VEYIVKIGNYELESNSPPNLHIINTLIITQI